jgi:hypothetical protein
MRRILPPLTVIAASLMIFAPPARMPPPPPGRVIAVEGDPLKDITELERVKFVMKGGAIIKDSSK